MLHILFVLFIDYHFLLEYKLHEVRDFVCLVCPLLGSPSASKRRSPQYIFTVAVPNASSEHAPYPA